MEIAELSICFQNAFIATKNYSCTFVMLHKKKKLSHYLECSWSLKSVKLVIERICVGRAQKGQNLGIYLFPWEDGATVKVWKGEL